MPPRIPDNRRAAILDDIRAGQLSCRAIATKHDVSDHAIRRIAKEAGITDAWSRDQTKKATEANAADYQARLTKVAGRMVGLTEKILSSYEEMTIDDWAKVSAHSRGIVLGIAADKARDLGPRDDGGAEELGSLLGSMLDTLVTRHADG